MVIYYSLFPSLVGFGWMGNTSFKEYSIFCIERIWVDWPGTDLPIYPRSYFGPGESGLCFGLIWKGLGIVLGAYGRLGEWACEPIF